MSGRVEIRKSRVHLTVGCGHDGLDGGVARVAHDVDVALVADGLPFQRVHMLPLHQNTKSAPSERQAHGGVCRTWYVRGTTVWRWMGDRVQTAMAWFGREKGFQRRLACVRRGGELTTVAWLGSGGTPLNCITCVKHMRVYRLSVAAVGMKTNAFENRRQVNRTTRRRHSAGVSKPREKCSGKAQDMVRW